MLKDQMVVNHASLRASLGNREDATVQREFAGAVIHSASDHHKDDTCWAVCARMFQGVPVQRCSLSPLSLLLIATLLPCLSGRSSWFRKSQCPG